MKKFLLTLAAVLGFASQAGSKTQITLDQLAAPTTTSIMVSVPGRGWTAAQLDPTLVLDTTTTPPTLKAPGGGGSQVIFVDWVTPTGTVDGVNQNFTLPSAPNPGTSLTVIVNGITQRAVVDYNLTPGTSTFTFITAPTAGSVVAAEYRR